MVEVFGMEVSLGLSVANLKEIQKDVKDGLKDIPADITSTIKTEETKEAIAGAKETGGFIKSLRAGIFGGDADSGMGQMTGQLALIGGAVMGIQSLVGSILNVMKSASPYLKGIFDYFGRAFLVFFRPFGDALATMLKPMALWMMKLAVRFLVWSKKSPTGEYVTRAGAGAIAGAVGGAAAGATIGALGGPIGAGAGALIGAGIGALYGIFTAIDWDVLDAAVSMFTNWIIDGLGWFAENPSEAIKEIGEKIKSSVTSFKNSVTSLWSAIGDEFSNFASDTYDEMISALKNIDDKLSLFGGWVYDELTGGLDGLRTDIEDFPSWIWNEITGGLATLKSEIEKFPSWFWNELTTALGNVAGFLIFFGGWLWNEITSALGNIKDWLSWVANWLYQEIIGSMDNIGTWLSIVASWIYYTIIGALDNIGTWLSGIGEWILNKIKDSFGFGGGDEGHQRGLNYVPETGPYLLHKGEQVVGQARSSGGGQGSTSVVLKSTINMTGNISSDIDLDAASRRASRMTELEMRKRGLI